MTDDERDKLRGLFPRRTFPVQAIDPWGRDVRMGWKTHDDKIDIKHQVEHFLDDIEETIRDPEKITLSLRGHERRCYYRAFVLGDRRSLRKVLVQDARFSNTGNIVTTYSVDGIPPLEQVLWEKP